MMPRFSASSGKNALSVIARRVWIAVWLTLLTASACAQQTRATKFRISGTVVNSVTGQPLEQARVFVALPQQPGDREVGITGADGRFQFDDLAAGKYTLGAEKHGFLLQGFEEHEDYSSAIVVGPGLSAENLVFRIAPEAVISGQIVDQQSEPVRDARVILFRSSLRTGKRMIRRAESTTTDDRGQYRFGSLQAGTYFVVVSARPWFAPYTMSARDPNDQDGASNAPLDLTYPTVYYSGATESSQATPLTLAAGDHVSADVTLAEVPSLHIRVRTPKLNAHQGYSVLVMPEAFPGTTLPMPVYLQTTISRRGGIDIAGLAPGQDRLQLVFPGKPTLSYSQEVDLQSDTEIDASSSDQAQTISGTVRVEGGSRLPPGAAIILRNSISGHVASARVLPDGQFQFDSHQVIPSGTYEVGLSTDNFFLVSLSATGTHVVGRTIEIRGSNSIRLSILASQGVGGIEGTVVSDGDKAVAGAMIVLVPDNPADNSVLIRRDQSDSDGTFTLPHVVPGHYTLLALRNGWDLEWMNPAVLKRYLPGGEPLMVERNGRYKLKVRVQ